MTRSLMRRGFALLIPLLAAATACTDVVGSGGDDVAGLSIQDASGTELVSVGSNVSGTLSVNAGAQRNLQIVLRTAAGVPVNLGAGQSVRVTVLNSQVAGWEATGGTSGRLVGRSQGNTSLRVDVIAGGSVDYGSPSIPVRVN